MDNLSAGFKEYEHTADWELEVWAPSFSEMLEQAAKGMYALSGTHIEAGERKSRSITLKGIDPESQIVNFLSELLYLGEMENLAFDGFEFYTRDDQLMATVLGGRIVHQDKEIKAVTYHNLSVRETGRGVEARIVFDV